jgi:pyridoxal phosphate enzyme (YggS family)
MASPSTASALAQALDNVRTRVRRAAERAKKNPNDIDILAVTKTLSPERVWEAWELGLWQFGESRVQEAERKIGDLKSRFPRDRQPRWHLIGHLQTNKARKALETFDCVQSVDSLKLMELLDKEGGRRAHPVSCLVEVKISEEPAKQGLPADNLTAFLERGIRFPFVRIEGLMGVPPLFGDPEKARPYFRHLKKLFDQNRALFQNDAPILSMGMSADFDVAIEEGSTMVRLGTALFGARA